MAHRSYRMRWVVRAVSPRARPTRSSRTHVLQEAPMSVLRRIALGLVALSFVSAPLAAQRPEAGDKLVFIVRHAEKASATDPDPSLSDAGKMRAVRLGMALQDADISDILVTPRKRTRETAEPLADTRSLTIHVVPFGASTPEHVDAVAAAVRAAKGGAVRGVGHSNTVNLIIAALGGPKLSELCDAEYSNLFIVRLRADAPASFVRAKYGAPDPADAATCAASTMR